MFIRCYSLYYSMPKLPTTSGPSSNYALNKLTYRFIKSHQYVPICSKTSASTGLSSTKSGQHTEIFWQKYFCSNYFIVFKISHWSSWTSFYQRLSQNAVARAPFSWMTKDCWTDIECRNPERSSKLKHLSYIIVLLFIDLCSNLPRWVPRYNQITSKIASNGSGVGMCEVRNIRFCELIRRNMLSSAFTDEGMTDS